MIFLLGCCVLFSYSCKKENEQPEVHLLKIVKTTWEGSINVAVYNYDNKDRLKYIKYKDYNKDFEDVYSYRSDGKLSTIENDFERYTKTEFHYKGANVDYLVTSYSDNNHELKSDTAFYTYDPDENTISSVYRNHNIYYQYFYKRDEYGRVIFSTGSGVDSVRYTWDQQGNVTRRTQKSRNFETGAYEEYITNYEYDSAKNFFKAISFPEELLFLYSLSPDPMESSNNCISGDVFYYFPIGKGPNIYSEYNSAGFPTKITSGDTSWELIYGDHY